MLRGEKKTMRGGQLAARDGAYRPRWSACRFMSSSNFAARWLEPLLLWSLVERDDPI